MISIFIMIGSAAVILFMGAFEYDAGTGMEAGCWMFLLSALAAIICTGVLSLHCLRRKRRIGVLGLAVTVFGGCWLVLSFAPGGNRVIARTLAPDGTEMCLIQRWEGEPYRVSFYYRRPGQQWGWFYYEHEDTRWWLGSIRLSADGKRAEIRRFISPVAYFDIPTESFTLVRWSRTLSPAQQWMAPGWKPEAELSRPQTDAASTEEGLGSAARFTLLGPARLSFLPLGVSRNSTFRRYDSVERADDCH